MAAEAGVRGVEIDARNEVRPAEMPRTAIRQFRKVLDDLRLRVCAVAFPTRRGYAVLDDLDRRVEATQAAMQLAYDLGAREVVINLGPVPPEASEALERLLDVLLGLAGYSDRVGVRLAFLTERESAADLSRLFSQLPDGSCGIALHPGLLMYLGGSSTQWAESLGHHVSYVYAADAARGSAGVGQEMELGRGTADIPHLLATLEGFDYSGWVTVDRREAALSREEAQNAVEYLTSL
jgi:sugar phosphate isomerase/epimerase